MANILILYSTTDGHTIKICQELQSTIEADGHATKLVPINEGASLALDGFDKIVIGASIRYGKHHKNVSDFVQQNEMILGDMPSAFFSVNVVARKPDKNEPDTNPYLKKFLKQVPWQPTKLAVFAGKIDYKKYRFFDRSMIRLIMYVTDGPTHPKTVADFTDWGKVKEFGKVVSGM